MTGCGYEVVAVVTKRCPTLSMWCWKLGAGGKVLAGAILIVLGLHLYATPEPVRNLQRVPTLRRRDDARARPLQMHRLWVAR